MPTDPIQPIIDSIKTMESSFVQPSCNSKEPFIKYPSTGTPPVIDFNVPQTSAFTTYGYLCKYFPPEYFKAFTKQAPQNNFYNTAQNMNSEQINNMFYPYSTVGNPGSAFTIDPVTKQFIPLPTKFHTAEESPSSGSPTPAPGGTVAHTALPAGFNSAMLNINKVNIDRPISVKESPLVRSDLAAKDIRPLIVDRFNGQGQTVQYVAKVPVPVPRIIVIEEYTTLNYLGNYGAGRTVKTFSLLPGEKTTISVRTYKDRITTSESSRNVIDSLSNSSATELDTLLQREQGDISSSSDTSGGSGSSYSTNTDSQNSSKSFGISGGLNLGFASIGGGYGKSISETSTTSGGTSSTYDYNHTATRQSNINALDSAMQKHVNQSNAMRQIDVNTSTSDMAQSGEEDVTVRELKNVNLNNTLNFVFRQLLQEYTTITYLSNVKFAYTNGYPESFTMVDLNNLPNMLLDIIDTTDPTTMDKVLCKLLTPYCAVMDYNDDFQQFVEKVTVPNANCLQIASCLPANEVIYRVKKDCLAHYVDGPLDVTLHGVILSVKKQTLQTSSLYADALLGRGDALDCFNQKAQNSENIAAYINNLVAMQSLDDSIQTTTNNQSFADQQISMGTQKMDVITQQMDVVDGITVANDKATLYKKVFGDCCDVPQSCCGGGCGCDCADNDDEPTA